MRLKHIKNSEVLIYKNLFCIKNSFEYKGKWNKYFRNDNPIEIEIGMGKGLFLISKAIDNPNINYIGIEKYPSVILFALKKLVETNINNLRIICIDAFQIDEIFDKEISKIYLNFSDPWPKKRHEKRRLTSKDFLIKYGKTFKDSISIEMKTDNDGLFEYSVNSFKDNGFKILEENRDYNSIYFTEYEIKFKEKGKNINYINVKK